MANELSKKEVSGVISPQTGTVEDTYEIPDKPGYDEMICKLQPSDPAHADLFNTILGRIISNVAFLKRNSVSHEELGIPEGVSPSVENQVPAIPESPVKRENLADGDNMGTILAKVRKWLGDLKSVAFSGSYKDLSDKPSIPTVPGAIKNPHPLSVNGKSYDGEVAVEVGTIGIAYGGTGATTAAAARTALGLGAASTQGIANNLTTTAAGYALDARQGKVLQDEVNQINSNLDNKIQWKLAGKIQGKTELSLPSHFVELSIICCLSDSAGFCFHIPYQCLTDTYKRFIDGGHQTNGGNEIYSYRCDINVKKTKVQLYDVVRNYASSTWSNLTSNTTLECYYR